jgi:septum site-determining protein MinC
MQNSLSHKPIDIKISTVVAISVVLRALDNATLEAALHEMTGGAADFFDNEFAVIDVSALDPVQLPDLDWAALIRNLKAINLNPVAVRHAPAEFNQTIRAHGLSVDDSPKDRPQLPKAAPPLPDEPATVTTEAAVAQAINPAEATVELAPATPVTPVTSVIPSTPSHTTAPMESFTPTATTLIIDTPVRAGQRIYARGADLIITAVVNNGAEVIADGSIHIYAPLRGRALAGASGNQNARIFALSMEPELLSISGMYRTFEDGIPGNLTHQPVQARLVGDRLDLSSVQLVTKNT